MGAQILAPGGSSFPYPAMIAGRYYRCPNATLGVSAAMGIGTLALVPKYVPNPVTLTRIGTEVTVIGDVGSLIRLGIYNNINGDFRPGALVIDAGTILGDSVAVQEIVIAQSIAAGWYWFGGVVQNDVTVQPTVRAMSAPWEPLPIDHGIVIPAANAAERSFTQAGIAGALPATFIPTPSSNPAMAIFVKC